MIDINKRGGSHTNWTLTKKHAHAQMLTTKLVIYTQPFTHPLIAQVRWKTRFLPRNHSVIPYLEPKQGENCLLKRHPDQYHLCNNYRAFKACCWNYNYPALPEPPLTAHTQKQTPEHLLPEFTRGWAKNGAITHKQIKTEPYVHQHTQTAHVMLLYVCVCRWKEEHQQRGSSWGLTDIAMGYLSVEFVFLPPPSIPAPIFPPFFFLSISSSNIFSAPPLRSTSKFPSSSSTQHGASFNKSGLWCIQLGNFYLMFGR